MNPFQRLRNTIDKLDIHYQYPEQTLNQTHIQNHNQNCIQTQNHNNPKQTSQMQLVKQWENKQTQYLRQINYLSKKVEQLTKQVKLCEIEKGQLIQEICKMQKKNQNLIQNLDNIDNHQKITDDKERYYREQIFRINSTIQQIGNQLNNQRNNKKNLNNQIAALKESAKIKEEQNNLIIQQYQNKIKTLKEQSLERTKMIEYNIKNSADERKQAKAQLELLKNQTNKNLQNQRKQVQKLRMQLYQTKLNLQVSLHRQKTLQEKVKDMEKDLQRLKKQNKQKDQKIEKNKQQIYTKVKIVDSLTKEIEYLKQQLEYEKSNMKVKVVQVKDQTLDLQLQMYKRQCRQLLQQKAIINSVRDSRKTIQPIYSIINRQYRTISQRNLQENQQI